MLWTQKVTYHFEEVELNFLKILSLLTDLSDLAPAPSVAATHSVIESNPMILKLDFNFRRLQR
jgi:hypothetical protein